MASVTSAINVMVDKKTKEEATSVLNELGLSMSTAINLFLRQVINNDGLPFEVRNPRPSKALKKALKEAEQIEKHPEKYKSYDNTEELFADLTDDN